jgi:CRISPR-associated protein Cmr6
MAKQSNLPLYDGARFHAPGSIVRPSGGYNLGLVWDRFFDGYTDDFASFLEISENKASGKEAQQGKADFIQGFDGKSIDVGKRFALRQMALVDALGGESRVFSLAWNFATGLGNDHPTENGFTWHTTLGAPYLPGSTVKGLVRGWLEWNNPKDARLKPWFGGEEKGKPTEQAGWFLFFDAVPVKEVTLGADVMTPHCGEWYEKGGSDDKFRLVGGEPDPEVVPADWHSPIPVTFLVVKKAAFVFGVTVREGLPEAQALDAKSRIGEVMQVLAEALEWAGAGAKTAVGYGRMKPEEAVSENLQQEMLQIVSAEKTKREAGIAKQALEEAARIEREQLAAASGLPPDLERRVADMIATWPEKNLPDWQKLYQAVTARPARWGADERIMVAKRVKAMMEAKSAWVPEEKNKSGQRARNIQDILDGKSG